MSLNNIYSDGKWCKYCCNSGSILCKDKECDFCYKKSFASHEKSKYWNYELNNNLTPRDILLSSHKKCWFNCYKCPHKIYSRLADITNNKRWCQYCCKFNKKLCDDKDCNFCYYNSFASNEKSKYWSYQLNNNKKPREFTKNTDKKCWFKCDICKENFNIRLTDISQNSQWCNCTYNKTETKLYEFLRSSYNITKQFNRDWCKRKRKVQYDFCIEELNLIIEVDGGQHFKQVRDWTSPEQQQIIDAYKMKCAINQGYSIIRIYQLDIWQDKNNWKE
jgi:very-short-patch-repair endonuclease